VNNYKRNKRPEEMMIKKFLALSSMVLIKFYLGGNIKWLDF